MPSVNIYIKECVCDISQRHDSENYQKLGRSNLQRACYALWVNIPLIYPLSLITNVLYFMKATKLLFGHGFRLNLCLYGCKNGTGIQVSQYLETRNCPFNCNMLVVKTAYALGKSYSHWCYDMLICNSMLFNLGPLSSFLREQFRTLWCQNNLPNSHGCFPLSELEPKGRLGAFEHRFLRTMGVFHHADKSKKLPTQRKKMNKGNIQ